MINKKFFDFKILSFACINQQSIKKKLKIIDSNEAEVFDEKLSL